MGPVPDDAAGEDRAQVAVQNAVSAHVANKRSGLEGEKERRAVAAERAELERARAQVRRRLKRVHEKSRALRHRQKAGKRKREQEQGRVRAVGRVADEGVAREAPAAAAPRSSRLGAGDGPRARRRRSSSGAAPDAPLRAPIARAPTWTDGERDGRRLERVGVRAVVGGGLRQRRRRGDGDSERAAASDAQQRRRRGRRDARALRGTFEARRRAGPDDRGAAPAAFGSARAGLRRGSDARAEAQGDGRRALRRAGRAPPGAATDLGEWGWAAFCAMHRDGALHGRNKQITCAR